MSLRFVVCAALALGGCRSSPSGTGPAGVGGATSFKAAPLDTSWQRSPGRLLAAGDVAPDFEGIAHTGMRVRLSAFTDKPVVVYFYPGDRDPGSITEARDFRDAWLRFEGRIGMVIGVSPDDRVAHKDFATGEQLPFLLVSDANGAISRAFGVPTSQRVTFVVGKDLKVIKVFTDVVPQGHAAQVREALGG